MLTKAHIVSEIRDFMIMEADNTYVIIVRVATTTIEQSVWWEPAHGPHGLSGRANFQRVCAALRQLQWTLCAYVASKGGARWEAAGLLVPDRQHSV